MTELAAQLWRRPALTHLGFEYTEIGDAEVAALLGELPQGAFQSLLRLDLFGNRLGDAAHKTILTALECGALPALIAPPASGGRRWSRQV